MQFTVEAETRRTSRQLSLDPLIYCEFNEFRLPAKKDFLLTNFVLQSNIIPFVNKLVFLVQS